MTRSGTLDQRALDSAITEFMRVFQPPRLTGDPQTDQDDYASAVGEAVESAIETYLRETAANGDTLADFLEPDEEEEPVLTGYVLRGGKCGRVRISEKRIEAAPRALEIWGVRDPRLMVLWISGHTLNQESR